MFVSLWFLSLSLFSLLFVNIVGVVVAIAVVVLVRGGGAIVSVVAVVALGNSLVQAQGVLWHSPVQMAHCLLDPSCGLGAVCNWST